MPKVFKNKKTPQTTIKPGVKTKKWANARELIKARFNEAGITRCEIRFTNICWGDIHGFAHEDKRDHLKDEDLYHVIGGCNPCHGVIEKWPREKMKKFVRAVIALRTVEV